MLKSAINRKKIEQNIFNILKKASKPLSTAEIATNLNKSWHTIIRHCLNMELEGKISKFTLGRVSAWMIKK